MHNENTQPRALPMTSDGYTYVDEEDD